ncbi:DUF4271 domain-containing protein [Flavobacteriaceae bacterium TP-CH-4]|uniref:DUF4271 domain-containing protein n=1 Tax=Pelagihabitans pacificus TaxID=2696054 RepID=A0A967AR73_9FLAO|nr:DUF4271 domain-containing protein [Pelagihabitans pacificus]NHF58674.1 DUF4271 domain-containing protein [Pelagihabitans pacificus]
MEPILRTATNTDWITILIFSSLLFVVMAKSMFYSRFLNFIILPFNNKYVFMYNKKDRLINWFHVFFTIFQTINFALFIYLAQNILLDVGHDSYPGMFLIILAFLLLFLLLKVALQLGNGYIFGSRKVISEIIFKKLSYLNYSGVIMFLANVTLSFVLRDAIFVVYLAIFLILLVNAIGLVTTLRNHQKFIATHFFYFILYLCALEISPLVIIGSYLNR